MRCPRAALALAAVATVLGGCNSQGTPEGADLFAGLVLVPTPGAEEDAFFLEATEVTNAQFAQFLAAQRYAVDDTEFLRHWREGAVTPDAERPISIDRKPQSGTESYPVVYVSFEDARAFAQWSGMRLPRSREWDLAAAYGAETDYPWGLWQSGRANTLELGLGHTTPVGFFQNGASPLGLYDLQGNVAEWCETEDTPVVKGGSFRYYGSGVRTVEQDRKPAAASRHDDIGFRRAADALPLLAKRCLASGVAEASRAASLRTLARRGGLAARAVLLRFAQLYPEAHMMVEDAIRAAGR
ncbi:MAG: SUMF1/EgtB/PvdO family nonheme iron enzyme [Planctomycetes bacterium]|nr:SUMF1/EgtB/PvdO family nonheme iron enzyme [Planctomycetota bacterium]